MLARPLPPARAKNLLPINQRSSHPKAQSPAEWPARQALAEAPLLCYTVRAAERAEELEEALKKKKKNPVLPVERSAEAAIPSEHLTQRSLAYRNRFSHLQARSWLNKYINKQMKRHHHIVKMAPAYSLLCSLTLMQLCLMN